MRFNPDLLELVPREQLDADFGGDNEFEFEKDSYWKQVVECVLLSSPLYETGACADVNVIFRFCGIAEDGTRLQKEDTALPEKEASPAARSVFS